MLRVAIVIQNAHFAFTKITLNSSGFRSWNLPLTDIPAEFTSIAIGPNLPSAYKKFVSNTNNKTNKSSESRASYACGK